MGFDYKISREREAWRVLESMGDSNSSTLLLLYRLFKIKGVKQVKYRMYECRIVSFTKLYVRTLKT